jgi:SET family sugar efflux transporter-like MFS transporter
VVALGIRSESYLKRLLVPSAALLWGLQIAFLSPALALILVTLYDASTAQVGWILTVYNASGFVASLLVPSYADRREDYLRPMLTCGVLTLVLALVVIAMAARQRGTAPNSRPASIAAVDRCT